MRRLVLFVPLLLLLGCGGSASHPTTTTKEASPAPLPSARLSAFDAARLSIACDQTLTASKEDTPATRARDAADAAKGFRSMDDPLGAQLAESVGQGNGTAFAYVLAICAANGASPVP